MKHLELSKFSKDQIEDSLKGLVRELRKAAEIAELSSIKVVVNIRTDSEQTVIATYGAEKTQRMNVEVPSEAFK